MRKLYAQRKCLRCVTTCLLIFVFAVTSLLSGCGTAYEDEFNQAMNQAASEAANAVKQELSNAADKAKDDAIQWGKDQLESAKQNIGEAANSAKNAIQDKAQEALPQPGPPPPSPTPAPPVVSFTDDGFYVDGIFYSSDVFNNALDEAQEVAMEDTPAEPGTVYAEPVTIAACYLIVLGMITLTVIISQSGTITISGTNVFPNTWAYKDTWQRYQADIGRVSVPTAEAGVRAKAKEQGLEDITLIYRGGSGTAENLTPRVVDVGGLSYYLYPPDEVCTVTALELVNLTGVLSAIVDGANHASVIPTDISKLREWITTRGVSVHPYTQILMDISIKAKP